MIEMSSILVLFLVQSLYQQKSVAWRIQENKQNKMTNQLYTQIIQENKK